MLSMLHAIYDSHDSWGISLSAEIKQQQKCEMKKEIVYIILIFIFIKFLYLFLLHLHL